MTKFEIKYAPKSLQEIVYPSSAIERQIAAIGNGGCEDHCLLYGPHGTGKTTTVKLMFETRYGCSYHVGNYFSGAEMNTFSAAKDAIDSMQNFLGFQKFAAAGNVVVVDEVDMIPMSAQKYLRNFMQKFPNVRFMFTTNHETSVYTGIRSVCRLVQFALPASKLWLRRAQHILHAEGVYLDDQNVLNILSGVSGSARDVCRLLQDVVLNANSASTTQTTVPPTPVASNLPAQPSVQPLTSNAAAAVSIQPASTAQPTP